MTKSAQRWDPAGVPPQKGDSGGGSSRCSSAKSGFQQGSSTGFQRRNGVTSRGSSRGSGNYLSFLFPCILAQMPFLVPLFDWTKAARAAVGTRGYAGPDGLGCTDTKVVIPPGTTIARISLTRPLLAADKQLCALTDWLHGVPADNPDVPILQVRLHTNDVDDVIQACSGWVNPAGKDKYPFKQTHLDNLRYVVESMPAMSLPNNSLNSPSPCRWKPELVGLTTPVLMESEDAVLPLPMCHALPRIGTSEPVKQVDILREVSEELSELGQTGHVFKEGFLAKDGDMVANIKIEEDNVGQRCGGIFNVAWPSPNRPPDPGDRVAVYGMIRTGNGGQESLQLPPVVRWAPRVLQGLSTKYLGLFLPLVHARRRNLDLA